MSRFLTRISFIAGLFIGVFLALLLKSSHKTDKRDQSVPGPFKTLQYKKWFQGTRLIRQPVSLDSMRYGNETYLLESNYLYDEINVLCLIMVKSPKNAKAAQETWGKHCNKVQLLKISTERKKIPIKRSKEESSWVLLCNMLKQVPEEYQWILIVHDYTFVLLENLRLFLAPLNPDDKYYLGHPVLFWSTVYNMGQAGYVLSRGSVDVLKQKLNFTDSCTKDMTYRNQEDYYLGRNLASFNITPADTRDASDLSTFHPYNLNQVFFPGENYYKFSIYPHKCCSSYSITFQSIEGTKMYTYYYLMYTLQLFNGGNLGNKPPSETLADDEIWKNFLKTRNIPTNITSEQYYKIWEDIVNDPTSFAKHMKREEYIDYV